MNKIKIVDCTLSEGGYTVNWDFGYEVIKDFIKELKKSNIDYIEAGFLTKYIHLYGSTKYNNIRDFIENYLNDNIDNIILSIDYKVAPLLDSLIEKKNDNIILKIKFNLEDRDDALKYIENLKIKGYRIFVQIQNYKRYIKSEFENLIFNLNRLNISAIILDNGFFIENENILKNTLISMDKIVKKNVLLGYQGYDADSNILPIIKNISNIELQHDLIILSSLSGIGKGNGLARTEQCLNTIYGKVDCHIKKILYKYRYIFDNMGYRFEYYLASKYGVCPEYINYWIEKKYLLDDELEELCKLAKNDSYYYKDNAENYLKEIIGFKRLKIGVIIPTCNRDESIKSFLEQKIEVFSRYNVDLIIYDSSDNDKTKNTVENFILKGYKILKYKYYEGIFDGFSLDHKIIKAYSDFYNDYDYLWICRDGLIINLEYIYELLYKAMKMDVDYIVVDSMFRCNKTKPFIKKYNECVEFCREQFHRIVTLGMLIVSKKAIYRMVNNYPINDTNYSLWQAVVPFHDIVNRNFNSIFICDNVFSYNVVNTKGNSFWNSNGRALEQWTYCWYKVISCLPEKYDNIKEFLYFLDMSDFHPFYLMSLLRMRGNNSLSLNKVKKYKNYILKVTNKPLIFFYIIAVIPKFICRNIIEHNKTRKILKGLYYLVKGIIPGEKNER